MNTILRQLLDGYKDGRHFFCSIVAEGRNIDFLATRKQAKDFFETNGNPERDFHGIVLQEIANLAMGRQIWRTTDQVSGDIIFGDPSPEITVEDLDIIAMAVKKYAVKKEDLDPSGEEETSGDGGEADASTGDA